LTPSTLSPSFLSISLGFFLLPQTTLAHITDRSLSDKYAIADGRNLAAMAAVLEVASTETQFRRVPQLYIPPEDGGDDRAVLPSTSHSDGQNTSWSYADAAAVSSIPSPFPFRLLF
jgi:hypothetical protein